MQGEAGLPFQNPSLGATCGVAGKQLIRPGKAGPTRCGWVPFIPSWCRPAWATEMNGQGEPGFPFRNPSLSATWGWPGNNSHGPGDPGLRAASGFLFILRGAARHGRLRWKGKGNQGSPSRTPPSAQRGGGRETAHTARETRPYAPHPGLLPPLRTEVGWGGPDRERRGSHPHPALPRRGGGPFILRGAGRHGGLSWVGV